MHVRVSSETSLELSDLSEGGITVDGDESFGPIEMFVASVALCSFSVLTTYAVTIKVPVDDVRLRCRWTLLAEPVNRIARIDIDVEWPALPAARRDAARRAVASCTLHHTLAEPVHLGTTIAGAAEALAAGASVTNEADREERV